MRQPLFAVALTFVLLLACGPRGAPEAAPAPPRRHAPRRLRPGQRAAAGRRPGARRRAHPGQVRLCAAPADRSRSTLPMRKADLRRASARRGLRALPRRARTRCSCRCPRASWTCRGGPRRGDGERRGRGRDLPHGGRPGADRQRPLGLQHRRARRRGRQVQVGRGSCAAAPVGWRRSPPAVAAVHLLQDRPGRRVDDARRAGVHGLPLRRDAGRRPDRPAPMFQNKAQEWQLLVEPTPSLFEDRGLGVRGSRPTRSCGMRS